MISRGRRAVGQSYLLAHPIVAGDLSPSMPPAGPADEVDLDLPMCPELARALSLRGLFFGRKVRNAT